MRLFPSCSVAIMTNNIMSIPVFSDLLTCALVIAFNLLLLESIDHFDLQIASSFYNMSTVVALTFIFCFLSENITSALLRVGDGVYESCWYRLPVRKQKQVTLPILRSQCVFRLEGLGLIYCSLETFVRVISFLIVGSI